MQQRGVDTIKTEIKPYEKESSKRQQIEEMFDSISHRYDFLNHFLSFGIDKSWRNKAIAELKSIQPKKILDVASGTGDLAITALSLNPDEVIGVDISEKMLEIGRQKLADRKIDHIKLIKGDSAELTFNDESFDAVTVGFGVRNFENLEQGLNEMFRVLKSGGKLVILEFSKPTSFPIKQLFNFYSKYLLPLWGKLFSGSSEAYTYLPESVKHFPEGNDLAIILKECGYKEVKITRLTFGICTVYAANK
jgi:demethylmenaquinone methyltransferase / 2-methoxy-6-polyprenyl-1,4-benzoquinol methylase